jgi:hypothetical protein
MWRPASKPSGRGVQCLKATSRLTRSASATWCSGMPASCSRGMPARRKGLISSPALPHAFIVLTRLADGRSRFSGAPPGCHGTKPAAPSPPAKLACDRAVAKRPWACGPRLEFAQQTARGGLHHGSPGAPHLQVLRRSCPTQRSRHSLASGSSARRPSRAVHVGKPGRTPRVSITLCYRRLAGTPL